MGRKSLKIVRQKEIIKAFYTVSKKEGLENASIAKVADLLKINPSLIMHYFINKEELLLGLIDYILERYHRMYKDSSSKITKQALIMQIDKLFSRKWNSLFDDGVFYSCYALTYRSEKIKIRFREIHEELRMLLVNTLENARLDNIINVGNVNETAEIIFAMIDGVYYYCGLIDNKIESDRQLELCKSKVFELLNIH